MKRIILVTIVLITAALIALFFIKATDAPASSGLQPAHQVPSHNLMFIRASSQAQEE